MSPETKLVTLVLPKRLVDLAFHVVANAAMEARELDDSEAGNLEALEAILLEAGE